MNMRYALIIAMAVVLAAGCATPVRSRDSAGPIPVDDFESGNLAQWTADENWTVDDNSAGGWYNGWQGNGFAWSGAGGEPKTGRLRSNDLVLQRDGIEAWIAGWADIQGRTPDRWNYVTLNLADGTEIDRVYAPNTTTFTPKFLSGRQSKGKKVYIEAVDNGTEGTYSMICLDNVVQRDRPKPAPLPKHRQGRGVQIENDLYLVEISHRNGVITRLRDKRAGIDFIREPRLAGNFKFTLPIRGETAWQSTEANYIMGEQQPLSSVKRDGDRIELVWRGPLTSVIDRKYDVDVTMSIALIEDRIEFALDVDNRTDLEIGELFYPMLGGTLGLVPDASDEYVDPKQTVMTVPGRGGAQSATVFQNFANQSWLGIMGPEQHYGYPDQLCMAWVDFYQKVMDRGLYIGAIDPIVRYKVIHVEMFPGSSGPRFVGNWPTTDELAGLPQGLRLSFVHMPYSPPHTTFEAAPVVVQAHSGDWRAAARLHGKLAPVDANGAPRLVLLECRERDWSRLPVLAKLAVDAGLDGLLVKDWRPGPDDAGEPLFDLPAGPVQDAARAAVNQCHNLGAKIVLSISIEPASQLRPTFESLRNFASTDRWGILDTTGGWNPPGSHAQHLAGLERRVTLNPGVPAYAAMLADQIAALASIGADGIYIAKFFGRTLDFNPNTHTTPDRTSWEGGLNALAAIREAATKHNPQFLILADDSFDRIAGQVDASGAEQTANGPLDIAYPARGTLIRISDPGKTGLIDGMDLNRATVVLAPSSPDVLTGAEWTLFIQRLSTSNKT